MIFSRSLLLLLALLSALGACHKYSDEQYEARVRELADLNHRFEDAQSERARLNEQVAGLRQSNEQMAARLRSMGEDVDRLQNSYSQLRTTNEQAQRELEAARRAQQQAEQRMSTYRQMVDRFRTMISSGRLRVRVVRGRMVIELPAGILFASGDAQLRGEGEEVLRQVAQVLREIRDRDFLISGHTDNVQLGRGGRFRDNWDLSTARAVNVARFLEENGMAPEHLGAAGFAEFQPAVPNTSPENQQANRRVEIVLLPNINELPDLSALDQPSAPAGGGTRTTP